ncbi:Hypothetical protein, putative [Bodo saltans]|uniref:Uncharacterized protein n=1 Tax=Bodo saltans TaxID=75058 RepID=A0A0S4ILN7_BODSA|nr:Hypothetical protein, putative [Bodo saltans]|eukprot:CUE71199.1 Hypothetical protein, putative [Bodo saltans]
MMSNNSNKELAPPVFMRHMQHQRDPLPGIGGGGGGGLHPQHLSTPSPGFGGGSPTSLSSNGAQHLLPLGQDVSASVSGGGGGGGDVTPHKALEESPMAVVGSLAVARRRARNQANAGGSSTSSLGASPEHNAGGGGGTATHVHRGGNFSDGGDMSPHRSPSPPEAGTPTAEASHSSVQQQLNMHDDGLSSTHYQQINHGPSKKTLNALLDVLDPDTDGSTIVDMLPRHNSGGVQQMHYQQQQQQQQQQPPSGPSTHFQRGSFQ